jgi:choice-of-anchor B domain-containing protein
MGRRICFALGYFLIGALAACGGGGDGGSNSPPFPPVFGTGPADCAGGSADGYACSNIGLARHLTLQTLGASSGSDVWGWTDPADGTEYVLMGLNNGTAFVRISDPENPQLTGFLPTQTSAAPWRDIKVYMNHAFIVADGAGSHGMQVFDLTRLRTGGTGQTFAADAIYGDFANAHNIAINESTGFAYVVGSNTCRGGLHMIDISNPINPMFAGCHSDAGAAHDTRCVSYTGPDSDHAGAEVCFNSNEGSVVIVDVSIKSSPTALLPSLTYPNLAYVHQGWLDDSQQYLIVNDELDELSFGLRTGTIVIDVADLDAPRYLYTHRHETNSIDHNLYIVGNRIFEANYTSGLRVLEFTNLATDTLTEVAFFDTYPPNDAVGFDGAWSVYPFFPSGIVAVSDIDRGLFILRPN